MTNNPTIDGVSRELLVTANVCVMRSHDLLVEQLKKTDHKDDYRSEIARLKDAHEKIKLLLKSNKNIDAPAVERQEPVEVVPSDNADQAFALMDFALSFALCNREHAGTRRDVKKAQAHLGALKDHTDALQSIIAQLQARVQELESVTGEIAGFRYRANGDWEWMDESPFADGRTHYKLGGEELQPLFTAPPAPVAAVPDGWKLVPVEPTELMVRRGDQNYSWSVAKIFKAMIEAAPACLDATAALNGVRK